MRRQGESQGAADAHLRDTMIDVIMRTGGRQAILLERAVMSLANQTAGAIRLLVVRHGAADIAALQFLIGESLRAIDVIDAPGANRGRAMAAGLRRVDAPQFSFLDDDDYLLEDHFLHLLRAARSVPAPAFAYCDILVEDERAPEAGRRLFRSGPAEPPLGRITDRISVHAFLADRAALELLSFDHWAQETAEDALLIAALLAKSTPVHTPNATCVYLQGRGDASAYLTHPNRAADELSFAREIAPVRIAIEAKFGPPELMDQAAYLAPFISAARHGALFADLRARSVASGLLAVRNGALATAVADDPTLASTAVSLTFEELTGVIHRVPAAGVQITASRDFAFAARLSLDMLAASPVVVAVQAVVAGGAFGLALAGVDGALAVEERVDPAPMPLEVHLLWDQPEPPTLVIRRLTALGAEPPHIRIKAVDLAFLCNAVTPGGDKAQAQAALTVLASAPRTILSPALVSPPQNAGQALAGGAREVDLGAAPWAYAFSIPLPSTAARGPLRVDLGAASSPVFVLRVDEAWSAVGERLEAPAAARPSTLWFAPLAEGVAARLVVQAGAAPAGARVTLAGVFVYPDGEAQ